MSERRLTILLALIGPAIGFAASLALAPDYLRLGFPLDDAWIHAVYARSLATEASYAYNPGEPATGATSLLWPLLLAFAHVSSGSTQAFVIAAKLLGAALHAAATVLVTLALRRTGDIWLTLAIAALVGMNPDLLAASLSGMEVALSTAVIAAALLAVRAARDRALFAIALLTYPTRPEIALLVLLLPLATHARCGRTALRGALHAAAGVAIGGAAVCLRTWLAAGRPLPATFYAKVGSARLSALESVLRGFGALFDALSIVRFTWVWLPALGFSIVLVLRDTPRERAAAAAFVVGTLGCAVSFALSPPIDVVAFYHQRYALPFVFCMLAAIPALWRSAVEQLRSPVRELAFVAPMATLLVLAGADTPFRIAHLRNDARNIDDVQVRIGQALSQAPASFTTWTVDAGAVRYFASGFVVDVLGLNTPEMLAVDAAEYTARHAPHALVVLPFVSAIEQPGAPLPSTAFKTSTAYSVTSIAEMGSQLLVRCARGRRGTLVLMRARHPFTCAEPVRHSRQ